MTEMLDRVRAVIKAKVSSTSWAEIDAAAIAVLQEMVEPTMAMADAGDMNDTGYAADVWRDMVRAAIRERPHG